MRTETFVGIHTLQGPTDFARSMLWDLQRQYFSEQGREAWRNSEVPHYITSNPTMANSYAELVFALRRDFVAQAGADHVVLHICELGGGSGRFCFHFLRRLASLCAMAEVPLAGFKYVLTDYVDANLQAWLVHPSLASYLQDGVLDVALFDVSRPDVLALRHAGITITPGSLQAPLAVLANYLFDSIPQDLYYVNAGQLQHCLVQLDCPVAPQACSTREVLDTLHCRYTYQPVEQPLDEADLQDLLASYRQQLQNTHLLFPATGLRCLAYLRSFSPHGMLLLSADKGELDIARLQGAPAPEPERHGSISLQVNFHALAEWCRQQGGLALLPGGPAEHVGVCALVLLASDARHTELKMAYRRFVDEFGPDDFFAITLHARDTFPRMDFGDLLAVLRLARGDSHQLARFMPRLHELAPELTPCERRELCRHFDQVWANYFPLGEEMDLANHIAYLLYNIGEFAQSRRYYRYSCERYGESANSLFNLALCERACGAILAAHSLIEQVLALEPGHAGALDLLAGMGQHRIRLTGK